MESDEENYKQCGRAVRMSGCPGRYQGKPPAGTEAGPPKASLRSTLLLRADRVIAGRDRSHANAYHCVGVGTEIAASRIVRHDGGSNDIVGCVRCAGYIGQREVVPAPLASSQHCVNQAGAARTRRTTTGPRQSPQRARITHRRIRRIVGYLRGVQGSDRCCCRRFVGRHARTQETRYRNRRDNQND